MKDSKYYFSRLDLTPLLDVVFILLFATLVIVGKHYNDTVTKEREKFTQTHQQFEAQLHQLQQKNADLSLENIQLIKKQAEFSELLQQQAEKWTGVKQALGEKEEKITLLENQLEEIKQKSNSQLAQIKEKLLESEESKTKEVQQINLQLTGLQQTLRAKTAENTQLMRQQKTLYSELDQIKQQVKDYSTLVQRLQENQELPTITTALKAEFVNEIINTYIITIKPIDPKNTGEGNKIILITRSGQERNITIYQQNKTQLKDFFDENIPHQNKDKTFIIFLRDGKSSLEYAKWVKDYLKDNQFYFKESLLESSIITNE